MRKLQIKSEGIQKGMTPKNDGLNFQGFLGAALCDFVSLAYATDTNYPTWLETQNCQDTLGRAVIPVLRCLIAEAKAVNGNRDQSQATLHHYLWTIHVGPFVLGRCLKMLSCHTYRLAKKKKLGCSRKGVASIRPSGVCIS